MNYESIMSLQSKTLAISTMMFVFLTIFAEMSLADSPVIEFTYVPPCGSSDDLEGRVLKVLQYRFVNPFCNYCQQSTIFSCHPQSTLDNPSEIHK